MRPQRQHRLTDPINSSPQSAQRTGIDRESQRSSLDALRHMNQLKAEQVGDPEIEARIRQYEQSIHDDLTGLYNRRYFDSRFRHELAYAKRHGDPLSVVLFDLDRFKDINDDYGHAAGDFVIRRLSERLSGHLRSEDILARYGGEEFAIILRSQGEEQAFMTAERVRIFIEGLAFPLGEGQRSLTISLGTSTLRPDGPSTADEIVAEADENLYKAKTEGRNRTVGSFKS